MHLTPYIEPMRIDEIAFINKRYTDLGNNYAKILRLFTAVIALGILCIIIGRRYNAQLHNQQLAQEQYLYVIGISILVWLLIATGIYFIMVFRYYLDSVRQQKIIEPIIVNYKHILEVGGKAKCYVCLWHFKHKVVEVTPADYDLINIGDEINIEYARYSKEFFSYF